MERNIKINYLRFSITDHCNMNCLYCSPLEKKEFVSRDEILSYEEMAGAVKLFVKKGIKKLRITGGEPLLKSDFIRLLKMFKKIRGLEDISLTTNGFYLKQMAGDLKKNGLDRINISLDTLKKDRFKTITGIDGFDNVWEGVENSLKAGLDPVKLNVILMKGINDDEIPEFSRLVKNYPLVVRFIELYPAGRRMLNFMSCQMRSVEAKMAIEAHFGKLKPISSVKGNGPAEYYKFKNSRGSIGFINNLSDYFCNQCSRIRMNCAGMIAPCLFSGYLYDIKSLMRNGIPDKKILSFIADILRHKPEYKKGLLKNKNLEMSSIGG